MAYLAAVFMGYLLGSSNPAYLVAKMKKVDIRANGSGNLGASNALTLLGWRAGVFVALFDIMKGAAVVLAAQWFFSGFPYVGAAAGVAAVIGHIFPVYLKFKGGKGFAAFVGMMIALDWKLAALIVVLLLVVTLVTDYIVCGTVSTVLSFPALTALLRQNLIGALVVCIAAAVILLKHRENYVRIWNGTEIGVLSGLRGDHRIGN